jgi:hypothetical protein
MYVWPQNYVLIKHLVLAFLCYEGTYVPTICFFHVNGLLTDIVSILLVSNWIGGRTRELQLIQGTILAFTWTEENHEKTSVRIAG